MQTDVLLDLLLQEAKKQNDTLGIMKQAMIKIAKQGQHGGAGGGSGGGSPPPNPNPNPPAGGNPFKTVLDSLGKGLLTSLSPLTGNSVTASTAVKAFGSGVSNVLGPLKAIPGPIGAAATAFDMIVKAGTALYEYLDSQLKMYQDLNSAGVQLSEGIFGFRKSAGSALLSMDQLSKVVTSNSDTFAAMNEQYGDGIKHFGELVNTITMAQRQVGIYGLSQQQIADITAKNYKLQKLYATEARFRDMNEANTSNNYISSLVQMSKVLGVSIDQIMKKNEEFAKSSRAFNITTYLKNMLPKDTAENVTKTFGELTSSLGDGGKVIQDVMSEFAVTGKLPQDIGQYGQALLPYFDKLKGMMESGVTDPREYQKVLKKITTDTSTMNQIANDLYSAQATGNAAGEQFVSAIMNMSKFMNDQAQQVPTAFETLQTRLENWIGDSIIAPFNKFFGDTANGISQFLLEKYSETGSIWDTAIDAFGTGMSKIMGFFWSLPARLLAYITGQEYDSSVQDSITELLGNVFKSFSMIGKTVWDFFFGSKDDVKKDMEIVNKAIFGVINQVKTLFQKIKDFLSNFSIDGIKDKLKSGADSLGKNLSEKWDEVKKGFGSIGNTDQPTVKPSDQTKSQDPTQSPTSPVQKVKPPQVKSKTEVTKSPPIQKPDEDKPNQDGTNMPNQPTQAEIDIMNILNKLNSGTADTVAALNNAVKYLASISTNTEPVRNA